MTSQYKLSDSSADPAEKATVLLPLPFALKFVAGLGIVIAIGGALLSRFSVTPEMDALAIGLMIVGGVPACVILAYGQLKLTRKQNAQSVKDT